LQSSKILRTNYFSLPKFSEPNISHPDYLRPKTIGLLAVLSRGLNEPILNDSFSFVPLSDFARRPTGARHAPNTRPLISSTSRPFHTSLHAHPDYLRPKTIGLLAVLSRGLNEPILHDSFSFVPLSDFARPTGARHAPNTRPSRVRNERSFINPSFHLNKHNLSE